MKKFIMFLMVLFATIGLTGCFTEADTLEWKTLPKSVYTVGEMTVEQFKESIRIKVNTFEGTLKDAMSLYPNDLTFTGFDLSKEGQKTITIKFKTLSIYWAYVVGTPDISTVTPEYGWYGNGSASTFILNNVNDLYGFANIVNGKRDGHEADDFAGKTVKLGANIDLTGKVWEPIGAAPRKRNVPLTPLFDLTGLENLFIDNDKLFTDDTFNLTSTSDVVKTISDEANQIYFDVTKKGNDITISICNTYEQYGEIAENRSSFKRIKKQELNDLGDNDAERLAALKDLVISKLQEQIAAGSIYSKYFIAPEIYAEAVSPETDNSVLLNSIYYKFTYSGNIEQGNFFSGTFDGQGHKIIGLSDVGYTPTVVLTYANSSTIVTGYTFGLFGVVNGNVTVKNVTFEEVSVVGAYYQVGGEEGGGLKTAEIDSVGSAIGFAFGNGNLTLDNVKVLSGSITAQMAAGGIIGRFYNKGNTLIQNCENRANITLTNGGYHAGGIAGYGTINPDGQKTVVFRNNINYGNIITGKVSTAGAMINYVGNGNKGENKPLFDNCRNFGNIYGSVSKQTDLGWGMVGTSLGYHEFNNCVNYGTVTTEFLNNE